MKLLQMLFASSKYMMIFWTIIIFYSKTVGFSLATIDLFECFIREYQSNSYVFVTVKICI